ncbi:MAG: HIT family protein, partial [Clostridiales bacterium]|nr:HIT family protein [Clostridiales bacterium]
MSENCIFCKIAAGDIPSACIYDDADFKVILDKFPSTPGHALIIPKKHAENLYDLDAETAAKIFPLAQKIASGLRKALRPDGINILQNNGEAAGQSVMHLHVHVIPRFKNDATK